MDGTLSVSISSNIITLTRGGGATQTTATTACSFVLSNIQNPTTAGSTGLYGIATYTTASVLLDDDLIVVADTITAPAGVNPFVLSGCNFNGVRIS